MYIDRVEITFDAGHRILGHLGKCASPHGHTFRAEVFVEAEGVNPLGFALDFGDLKSPLKAWIDQYWDHGFLLNAADAALRDALGALPEAKLFVFERGNPSAELLARELFDVAAEVLGLPVARVRIWESPTQYSEYVPTIAQATNGQAMNIRQEMMK